MRIHFPPFATLSASLLALAACADHDTLATAPVRARAADAIVADANVATAPGAVFTETNDVTANAVVAFDRAADGTLTRFGAIPTGGRGIGGTADPLTSQYALVLSHDHRFLYAVDAGSDDIAVFRIGGAQRLALVQRVSSGGVRPTSLAISDRTLYALNAGSNTVAGFVIDGGTLVPRPTWTRALSAGASGAAEVRFSPDARVLVVSERLSATFDTYAVQPDGALGALTTSPSAGVTPFGFDFTVHGDLVASEAGPGTASSYAVRDGALAVRTASLPTLQRATCWLVVTPNGRYAFTANAGSGTVTGFAVSDDGALTRLAPNGISADLGAGSTPLDLETTGNGRFLYVLKAGTGTIGALVVGPDGGLDVLGDVPAVAPRSGQMGIAAF